MDQDTHRKAIYIRLGHINELTGAQLCPLSAPKHQQARSPNRQDKSQHESQQTVSKIIRIVETSVVSGWAVRLCGPSCRITTQVEKAVRNLSINTNAINIMHKRIHSNLGRRNLRQAMNTEQK